MTLDFAYDGGGPGKGGKATLYVNGKPVAEGRVEKTQPNIFSADETADVGIDNQTPVAEGIGIGPETRFTGKINKMNWRSGSQVCIRLGGQNQVIFHAQAVLITPEVQWLVRFLVANFSAPPPLRSASSG